MNKKRLLAIGGTAALGLALAALPAISAGPQKPEDKIARLQQKIEELQARLEAERENRADQKVQLDVEQDPGTVVVEQDPQTIFVEQEPSTIEVMPKIAGDDVNVLIGDDGGSWLGVELHEVTADNAKELKLSAERGVVLGKIIPDSPAAKAGLKEKDVVTEVNGQRVEGSAQFRRMIREIPSGRAVQLTIWRDGRSQTVSATLGKSEERRRAMKMMTTPGTFAFRMPEIPDIPSVEWNGDLLFGGGQPRLGIDAEDLNGQLGTFFGAPDGEAILVREVHSGTPAEKAGVKAGDVITSIDGERIRSIGELREKLSSKHIDSKETKQRTVKLGVLRNKSEISLNVELPASEVRTKHFVSHRTNI